MINEVKIPRWLKNRYLELLNNFKTQDFSFQDAFNLLKNKFEDSDENVKVCLSELKKAGLLEVERDSQDKREKIYKLKNIFQADKNLTKDELINLLKNAADIIRTRVDYTFILLLLFYKAYSDKWEEETEKIAKELKDKKGWKEEEALREAETGPYHIFQFPKEYLWNEIRKDPARISEKFSLALKKLAELNPNYSDIFNQFDFYQFTSNTESSFILHQLIELFSKISFKEKELKNDILGDAYEWILKYFAPTKAKEGEVYSAREVIRLMVEILDPKPQKSLYDPALGSGGMLIVSYKYVREKYGKEKADTLFLYGQEVNDKTLALSKMNMLLHNISNFEIKLGDTLLYPKFKEGDFIKKFDYVIANPPWNQDGYDENVLKKGEYWQERFSFGFSTKQSADWIWIQHMIASAKEKVAVVIDTGAVSRGGREKLIRQKVVEKDLIESVILLPEKLFYNAQAPAVIIVFNKQKPEERKNKILLINASKEFIPGKRQNVLGDNNIKKIVEVYREFKEVEKFSKIITIKDVKEADYNLSPSRFVSVIEEEKYRPIGEIVKELEKIEEERKKVEERLKGIIEKL